MATTELSTNVKLVTPAMIQLDGLDQLRKEITRLSEHMELVEVTEDNLQESKRLLAQVRKEWKGLDTQRIALKKELLKPYMYLDDTLKEFKRLLDIGEQNITSQVAALVEKERRDRWHELQELFDQKHKAYNAPAWLTFDLFITPRLSLINNKATSRIKRTNAVRDFFEKYLEDDMKLRDSIKFEDERNTILITYSQNGMDMDKAIQSFKNLSAEKERVRQAQQEVKKQVKPKLTINAKPPDKKIESKTVKITLKDSNDFELMVHLLLQNNIEFELHD